LTFDSRDEKANMNAKVIVIDDSKTARLLVREAVGGEFMVLEAADAAEGLATIGANLDAAVVLCDFHMPGKDGVALLADVRAQLPSFLGAFLMLTTEADSALIARARALGAKGWVIKPFRPHALLSTLQKITQASKAPPLAAGGASA
jgi:two-component system chemotaxis response regulator CheY